MHPDQHAIVFDPRNTNIAFVGLRRRRRAHRRHASTTPPAECDTRRRIVTGRRPGDLADCQQWLSKVPHRIVNINAGLATLQFVQLAADPSHPPGDLLGGTQDNGTFPFSGSPQVVVRVGQRRRRACRIRRRRPQRARYTRTSWAWRTSTTTAPTR